MTEIYLFATAFAYSLFVTWPVVCSLIGFKIVLGVIVGRIERWSTFDSIYFALITGMTVGYGDFSPSHKVSKICAVIITLCGLVFSGIVVAASVEAMRQAMSQEGYTKDLVKADAIHFSLIHFSLEPVPRTVSAAV